MQALNTCTHTRNTYLRPCAHTHTHRPTHTFPPTPTHPHRPTASPAISVMSKRGLRPLPIPSSTVKERTTTVGGGGRGGEGKRGVLSGDSQHPPQAPTKPPNQHHPPPTPPVTPLTGEGGGEAEGLVSRGHQQVFTNGGQDLLPLGLLVLGAGLPLELAVVGGIGGTLRFLWGRGRVRGVGWRVDAAVLGCCGKW